MAFNAKNPHLLGYWRGEKERVLVLANFSESVQTVSALTLSALPEAVPDLVSGKMVAVVNGVKLAPYQFVWLKLINP
jgi:amylosucrase